MMRIDEIKSTNSYVETHNKTTASGTEDIDKFIISDNKVGWKPEDDTEDDTKDLVSVSEDGDTVEVDQSSLKRLQDEQEGRVRLKPSTVGRTEAQLRQMYLDGEITKYELDRAMEIKEDRKEAAQVDEKQFFKEAYRLSSVSERTNRDEIEIKKLYGPYSADTPNLNARVEILNNLERITTNMLF